MNKCTLFYTLCVLNLMAHTAQAGDISSTLQKRIEAYIEKLSSFNEDRIRCLHKKLDLIINTHHINTDTCIVEEQVNENNDSIFHILAQTGSPRLLILAQEIYCNNLIVHKNKQGKTAIELARTPFISAILQDAIHKSMISDKMDSYLDKQDYYDVLQGNYPSSDDDEDKYINKLW